jgi:hypothetical protein
MAQRRFGPTRGAGTVIIEKSGQKSIELAPYGWCGYAGLLEKGPVGELIQCQSRASFLKKCGSYIDDSLLPDNCFSYYRIANGAGGLYLVRVTDGNEVQAEKTIYARKDGVIPVAMGKIKAHNGGRWGGKKQKYDGDVSDVADIDETEITTGITTWVTDQWKGGYVELEGVANTQYPIIGNTSAGVIQVAADQTMDTDLGAGSETGYTLFLDNDDKAVSFEIGDGEQNPDTEFSLSVYVDGEFVKKYSDLSTDPTSTKYWVSIINNDDSNYEIEAEDLWTGAHVANVRPANYYGTVSSVTDTILTANIHYMDLSGATGDPTIALGTVNAEMVRQTLTITMTSATEGGVVSSEFGSLGTITFGTEFDSGHRFVPPFTITAGSTACVAADVIIVYYKPLENGEYANGYLYPDKANEKLKKYRIVSNAYNTITVADGSDMTSISEADDQFMVVATTELAGGIDGNADIADSDYTQQAWDTSSSPFNRLKGTNAGLVKMATPGVTSTTVAQAGVAYAEAKNHQYRYEIPSNITTEIGAISQINDTYGRNDFAVCSFPSYCYVADPLGSGEGKRKLVTNTGMVHGREARFSGDYEGYHKAQAGIDATLPEILSLTTGNTLLDEESLNPVGISVIKKVKGNYIIWGDRTLYLDSTWKWKHQREQMSYYEHVLSENYDWIIFQINDSNLWGPTKSSLRSFFLPEWRKKNAIRGDTFSEACIIKIDGENNTDATMAQGDFNASISLRLADTVERFIIEIGKQGIFDSAN